MDEIDKTNLTDQTKYRLNKITMIKHYFVKEINQEKSCIKIDYIDKILIVLSAACGGVSFTFFYKHCRRSCRNSKRKLYFNLSVTTGIIKKLLSITRNKKKKQDKILILG